MIALRDKNVLSYMQTVLESLVISISGNAAGIGESSLRGGLALM